MLLVLEDLMLWKRLGMTCGIASCIYLVKQLKLDDCIYSEFT